MNRHTRFAFTVALICGAAVPSYADNQALASGIYGASLGAGGSVAAERSAFGQNPAALRPRSLGLRLDFHRPYGIADVRVAEAGFHADLAHWGAAWDWRATEITDLYAEQGFQCAPAARFGPLDLGFAASAWRTEWPGSPSRWEFAQAWGFAWRPAARLKLGGFAAGLPWPGDRSRRDRILQAGMEAAGGDPETAAQILRLDFRRTGETPWRVLASLSLRPHPVIEATAGLAVPPFQASLGCRIAWGGAQLSQSLRYHRYLGRTWLSGIAYNRPLP